MTAPLVKDHFVSHVLQETSPGSAKKASQTHWNHQGCGGTKETGLGNACLTNYELNLVDLACREWIVPFGTLAQAAVEAMIADIAHAPM